MEKEKSLGKSLYENILEITNKNTNGQWINREKFMKDLNLLFEYEGGISYPNPDRETSESIPQCPNCETPMRNAIDSKTKKVSKYLWKCDCNEMKGMVLSRG